MSGFCLLQDRRAGVLHGVIGCQSQLRSGHCCICTASCGVHPSLDYMVPATVLPIMYNSDSLKVYPLQSPPLVHLDQAIGLTLQGTPLLAPPACPLSLWGVPALLWPIPMPQFLQRYTCCLVGLSKSTGA